MLPRLALARSGNPIAAALLVKEMLDLTDLSAAHRSDALSLAGRIRKDFAARAADPGRHLARLRKRLAFISKPTISAAILFRHQRRHARPARRRARSRTLAAKIRDGVLAELDQCGKEADGYLLATLGEAYLILGDATAAKGRYAQAVVCAREAHNDGDIASMRRQLLLLREHLPIGEDLLGLFHLGPVVVLPATVSIGPAIQFAFPPTPPWKRPYAAPSRMSWTPWKPPSVIAVPAAAATFSSAN